MEGELINKVAQSGLITLDPADFASKAPRLSLDLAQGLWQGVIVREKEFRDFLSNYPWIDCTGAWVAVFCSQDAIIPQWVYLLVAEKLHAVGARCYIGSAVEMEKLLYRESLALHDWNQYTNARVLVKGCSSLPQPEDAFAALAEKLLPRVKSLMYGEACSTVPVFKKK